MTEPTAGGASPIDPAGAGSPRPGPARSLASAVLVLESLVVVFAGLVAQTLSSASTATVWWVAGGTAVACLVVTGLLRHPWAYVLGTLLQLVVVGLGLLVTAMYALGLAFLVLWLFALALPRIVADKLAGHPPTR